MCLWADDDDDDGDRDDITTTSFVHPTDCSSHPIASWTDCNLIICNTSTEPLTMIHYPEKHHDNGYKPQAPPPRHVTSILSPQETCEALVKSAVARHHQRIDILFLKVSPSSLILSVVFVRVRGLVLS